MVCPKFDLQKPSHSPQFPRLPITRSATSRKWTRDSWSSAFGKRRLWRSPGSRCWAGTSPGARRSRSRSWFGTPAPARWSANSFAAKKRQFYLRVVARAVGNSLPLGWRGFLAAWTPRTAKAGKVASIRWPWSPVATARILVLGGTARKKSLRWIWCSEDTRPLDGSIARLSSNRPPV